MKHQYFADVNDYLKYGLLRGLIRAGLRLGVCWMLTPDDGRADGRKTGYVSRPDLWRRHDPELFDALAASLAEGAAGRDLARAETGAILPDAIFAGDTVPDDAPGRAAWFDRALAAMSGADLVFFDPDNGIEVPSVPRGRRNSSKYVRWDELARTWERGHSILVFQHYARENRRRHAERLASGLATQAPGAAITLLTTSNMLFLLAGRDGHRERIARARDAVARDWAGRISVMEAEA